MHGRPSRLIIPQYGPLQGLSLVGAAELLGAGRRAVAAQIIQFAVRKVITIAREPGTGRRKGFTLSYTGADPGGEDEYAVLVTLFGGSLTAGVAVRLEPGRNRALGEALKAPHRWIIARLVDAGLAREKSLMAKVFGRTEPVRPTPLAFPLIDHLWGLHDYIRLAEKDRLAFLQSPSGAERTNAPNELEVLVLNEKLLPYAVLFGLEKQWMKELDIQYRSLPPELADVGDLLIAVELIGPGLELVGDLATLIEAADALEGVGAVFGGIGDFLGGVSFLDFG
jgi:hypothetical protein